MTRPALAWLDRPAVYLSAAAAVAVASYLLFHVAVLGGVPHVSDEVVYLFQAQTLARGHLAAPAPALPEFFRYLNVVIDAGRGVWFGIYPPGWPAVLAPFVKLGIGPWANALVNAAALLTIYRLACEFTGRRIAQLALLLGLASPFAWAMGASYLAHPLALLLTAGAMLGITVGLRRDRPPYIIGAGALVGILATVRPLDALAVGTVLAALLLWQRTWKAALLMTAAAAPFVALLLLYNRALTGSAFLFPQQLYNPRDALGFGPSIGKIATYGTVGHTPLKAAWNLGQNLRSLATNLFGWPFVSFAFVPFAYFTRRSRRRRGLLLLTALAVAVTLGYACYWYDGVMYGARFYYLLMPLWLVLTAQGMAQVHTFCARRRMPWAMPAVAAALTLFGAAFYVPHYARKLGASYNCMDNNAYAAARRAGVAAGVVLVPPIDRGYPSYGGVFWRNSPWLDGDLLWAKDLGPLVPQLKAAYPRRRVWRYDGNAVTPLSP
jgi:hypothetical protein